MSDLRDELPILRAASADEPAQTFAPVPELTVGQMLQQARQARGFSLQDVSERLKVSVKRLEALEADRFETGAALQVGRAMVASLARQLGLNPQELLAKMPQAATVSIVPTPHEGRGSYRPGGKSSAWPAGLPSLPRIWWLTAVFLGLAGFVFLMPYADQWWASVRTVQAPLAALPSSSAPLVEPTAPTPVPEAPASELALASASTPVAVAVATPQASVAATLAAPAPTALPLIVFKAHGPTWVEVIDANGQVLLRRTLTNAETVQTGGTLPLSVVVGRADHTEVTVRSMPYPLDAVTTENVARFKVQ